MLEYVFIFFAGALPIRTHGACEKVRFTYLNTGRLACIQGLEARSVGIKQRTNGMGPPAGYGMAGGAEFTDSVDH